MAHWFIYLYKFHGGYPLPHQYLASNITIKLLQWISKHVLSPFLHRTSIRVTLLNLIDMDE